MSLKSWPNNLPCPQLGTADLQTQSGIDVNAMASGVPRPRKRFAVASSLASFDLRVDQLTAGRVFTFIEEVGTAVFLLPIATPYSVLNHVPIYRAQIVGDVGIAEVAPDQWSLRVSVILHNISATIAAPASLPMVELYGARTLEFADRFERLVNVQFPNVTESL